MLYEVITYPYLKTFVDFLVNNNVLIDDDRLHVVGEGYYFVITSYSIHYTKLYDCWGQAQQGIGFFFGRER